MLKTMHFIHINRVYYEWLQPDERKMSPNVLKDLLDTTTITISCPIICHLVITYIVSTISSPIISHLVTTYIVCVNGKYKIQLDFLFGDNIAA